MGGFGGGVRKAWLAAAIGAGGAFLFLVLLIVGTYSAAASMTADQAVGLAPGAVPAEYESLVEQWGQSCAALSPPLLAAQLYQESGWNPKARSGADAEGIAQFEPGT